MVVPQPAVTRQYHPDIPSYSGRVCLGSSTFLKLEITGFTGRALRFEATPSLSMEPIDLRSFKKSISLSPFDFAFESVSKTLIFRSLW
jgi:hypothetical protein